MRELGENVGRAVVLWQVCRSRSRLSGKLAMRRKQSMSSRVEEGQEEKRLSGMGQGRGRFRR